MLGVPTWSLLPITFGGIMGQGWKVRPEEDEMEQRREGLPAGSDMHTEVSGPAEGHGASGARSSIAVGSVVVFHGRVEEPFDNDGPPLGSLHGSVGPLPKDQ